MTDPKAVRDVYQSLKTGENKFNFSQLQGVLRESGVDVENFDLRLTNDQQALLCVAEKFFLDVQKEEGGTIQFPDPLTGKPMIEIKVEPSPETVKDSPAPIIGNPLEEANLRKRILQPALFFDLPVTGSEGYWECWERLYNCCLTSLYSNSSKVSVLRKRELNLC